MSEVYVNVLLLLLFGLGCTILANLLKERKARIIAVVTQLIQKVETAVEGSGVGAEKKTLVIAQLQAMNIKVTEWLSKKIDEIVAMLNEKKAWLTENAKNDLPNAASELVKEIES